MTIIDFHTHIFPDAIASRALAALLENAPGMKPRTDGTLDGLQKSMHRNGIDTSILLPVATKPSQVETINANCLSLQSPSIIPFGSLHQDYQEFELEIGKLKKSGIKGIKLHPEYQNFYVDDKKMFPIYEALQASGLIVVFHAGKDPGPFSNDHALPTAFKNIARQFPTLKIVAAHMGGWMAWDEVEQSLGAQNIYFDTSAVYGHLSPSGFMRLVSALGIDVILFGSDSPWFDQGKSRAWIEQLPLTDGDKEKIFFKNALMLLEK
jgi:predicted TIM-barrel fold metal-dependent hydrolase